MVWRGFGVNFWRDDVTKAVDEIRELARENVRRLCSNWGDSSEPDGGWDGWLLSGIGVEGICQMFGEDPQQSPDGDWSIAMAAKLQAYRNGALAGAADYAREQEQRDAARAATRDNNDNLVRIVPTGWQSAASDCEVRDCQLVDEPGKGYLSELGRDGMESCWSWYGPGERYATLAQMLSMLAAGGHIVPAQEVTTR